MRDSALRAVQACEPYSLPPAKYEFWKDIVLNFDPRDMFKPRTHTIGRPNHHREPHGKVICDGHAAFAPTAGARRPRPWRG